MADKVSHDGTPPELPSVDFEVDIEAEPEVEPEPLPLSVRPFDPARVSLAPLGAMVRQLLEIGIVSSQLEFVTLLMRGDDDDSLPLCHDHQLRRRGEPIPLDLDMEEWEVAWLELLGAHLRIYRMGMVGYTWFQERFRGTEPEMIEEIE
ncbi:hypothetical protein ACSBR2_042260 [Camellia fascicularis]